MHDICLQIRYFVYLINIDFKTMKKLISIIAAFAMVCFFISGCIIGGNGEGKDDPGTTDPQSQQNDEKPKPPDADAPLVEPNFNDTVQIN